MKIWKKNYGEEDENVAETLVKMVDACKNQEKSEDAISEILVNLKKEFGEDSIIIAVLLQKIGNLIADEIQV